VSDKAEPLPGSLPRTAILQSFSESVLARGVPELAVCLARVWRRDGSHSQQRMKPARGEDGGEESRENQEVDVVCLFGGCRRGSCLCETNT